MGVNAWFVKGPYWQFHYDREQHFSNLSWFPAFGILLKRDQRKVEQVIITHPK